MKGRLSILGFVLVLSALIISGCGKGTSAEVAVDAPNGVREARDAALTYIADHYGEQVRASGISWTEENITPGWPNAPVPGGVEYRFTAEGWVVRISYAVLPPEWIVYRVVVTNRTAGFEWKGEVNAAGQATEQATAEEVRAVRDAALAYVIEHYAGQASPEPGRTWTEMDWTREGEGWTGSVKYDFTSEGWAVTVYCPVLPPEVRVCTVVVANQTTGFQWQGEVDAAGQVTVLSSSAEPVLDIRDPGRALNIALTYISEEYGEQAALPDLTWVGDRPPLEQPIDGFAIEFTSDSAPDWVITVTYGGVVPEAVGFEVVVANESTGFRWEGEVDAAGQVTELSAPTTRQPAACWYGRVESTPADSAIDDYLVLLPEEARRAVDVIGADEAVEAQIDELRDSGIYAHFWGTLSCDVPGWGGCQLVVSRLRPEGPGYPFSGPDLVEGWTGRVFSTPDDAQSDDCFVLSGSIPMRYGIDSAKATIASQLESLRDAPAIIRLWGQVTCPAVDFQGVQIQVSRIEIVMEAPSAQEGYEGWKPYLNEQFGYALWHPGECAVMGTDLDEAVQFAGQEWPVLTVRHYDSDFYHPRAGTDISQWIADHDLTYDDIETETEIAGLPTVHLIYDEGPGWYASDEYYFIKDDQLFSILILHTGGQQDWDLYDKFLQSFSFLELQ